MLVAEVHIETSGAYPLSGTWDWFVFQRKNKLPTETVYNAAQVKGDS
jgi:hypothetical protein